MTGDFNGDGKIDALAIQPGSVGPAASCIVRLQRMPSCSRIWEVETGGSRLRERLLLWESAAQAREQPVILIPTGISTSFFPTTVIRQDFYFCLGTGMGRLAPLSTSMRPKASPYPVPLVGDLNNDKKLDFIWGGAVFLGNGDGTFKQLPLTIPAKWKQGALGRDCHRRSQWGRHPGCGGAVPVGYDLRWKGRWHLPDHTLLLGAVADLLPISPFATGDVNGDGNPDLLVGEPQVGVAPYLKVFISETDTATSLRIQTPTL